MSAAPSNQNGKNSPQRDPIMDQHWEHHEKPHREAHEFENDEKYGKNGPSGMLRILDLGWLRAEFGILAQSGKIWHSTTALDKNPVQPKRGAERDQTVVHALLRTKDQIPKQSPAPDLKRKIANKLHDIEPVPARQAGVTDALRIGAVPACVAVLLAVGIHFATTNMSSSNSAKKPAGTVATGDADPLNPTERLKPLTPEELWVPIHPSKDDVQRGLLMKQNAAADNATIQSMPLSREANAFQRAGEAVREALIQKLPQMPERPK